MAYKANPFLERMSERSTSDNEFVRLFSPKILERLDDDAFSGAVHVFRSPPGGGKTTLLRAFTPSALRAFWNTRHVQDASESYRGLLSRGIFDEQDGPQLLGVFLSCAAGYADLPPGAAAIQEGLFRALLNCRIVLRALRSVASLVGRSSSGPLDDIKIEYDQSAVDLHSIPRATTLPPLLAWAEQRERAVYAELDSISGQTDAPSAADLRFDSILWLQAVRFIYRGQPVAPKRLVMIDDLHKLRKSQRTLLMQELTELRPTIPVWLAERTIALGDEVISQGARNGRDLHTYSLDEIWSANRGNQHQFVTFAQNILDRRLGDQNIVPIGRFAQYLADEVEAEHLAAEISAGVECYKRAIEPQHSNPRYANWLASASQHLHAPSAKSVVALFTTSILVARDEGKRQLALELEPLSQSELDERDSAQVQGAAEIFVHDKVGIPYYFGIDRLCTLATANVEELLALAAALFEGLQAKQVLRKPELLLSAAEQEKLLLQSAKKKREFIPSTHTEGTRAVRLLDAIGAFCREKTFLPTAPYAPGLTGIRLSDAEMAKTKAVSKVPDEIRTLRRVLSECVAENLLVTRDSAASGSRESGTVLYLNRTLCAHYGLPLQFGGWQDVTVQDLIRAMERGQIPGRRERLEFG